LFELIIDMHLALLFAKFFEISLPFGEDRWGFFGEDRWGLGA
jgi:hypothetical protein